MPMKSTTDELVGPVRPFDQHPGNTLTLTYAIDWTDHIPTTGFLKLTGILGRRIDGPFD